MDPLHRMGSSTTSTTSLALNSFVNSFVVILLSLCLLGGTSIDAGQNQMSLSKDEAALIPTWDGELAGWPEYARRVRLAHSQTAVEKRYTLGPRLVLKLRGKAWEIASNVDHQQLDSQSGAQYLLNFLKQRLGRLPVPDVGQHLEHLFMRRRRPAGMDMVSWANTLRESYRKVQRALHRTMPQKKDSSTQTDLTALNMTAMSPSSSPTSSTRRRLSGSEPQGEPQQDTVVNEGRDDLPAEAVGASEGAADGPGSPGSWNEDWWAHRSWWHDNEWSGDWDGASWSSGWWKRWDAFPEAEAEWEEQEKDLPSILAEEVLGWLLMRRANLPASSRLSVQASAGNSLRFNDIEQAMRQQDDELLSQERQRAPPPKHRTYWVEQEGQLIQMMLNFPLMIKCVGWNRTLCPSLEMSPMSHRSCTWMALNGIGRMMIGTPSILRAIGSHMLT